MNDDINPKTQAANPKTGRSNAQYQPDQNELQEELKKTSPGKNAQDQDRSSRSDGPSRTDGMAKSDVSKGTDVQRFGEDRKQGRAPEGSSKQAQHDHDGGPDNHPLMADTSATDLDTDMHEQGEDRLDPAVPNRSNAAKLPSADASKFIKHTNDSVRPDSNRDGRDQRGQNQSGRKS